MRRGGRPPPPLGGGRPLVGSRHDLILTHPTPGTEPSQGYSEALQGRFRVDPHGSGPSRATSMDDMTQNPGPPLARQPPTRPASTGSSTGSGPIDLRRNGDDKWIAGTCSGIADRLGVDPIVVRAAARPAHRDGRHRHHRLPRRCGRSCPTTRTTSSPSSALRDGDVGGIILLVIIAPVAARRHRPLRRLPGRLDLVGHPADRRRRLARDASPRRPPSGASPRTARPARRPTAATPSGPEHAPRTVCRAVTAARRPLAAPAAARHRGHRRLRRRTDARRVTAPYAPAGTPTGPGTQPGGSGSYPAVPGPPPRAPKPPRPPRAPRRRSGGFVATLLIGGLALAAYGADRLGPRRRATGPAATRRSRSARRSRSSASGCSSSGSPGGAQASPASSPWCSRWPPGPPPSSPT